MTRNCCLLASGVLALALVGCDSGEGDWVPSPHHLAVTGFAPDLVSLSWMGSDFVEGYRVERKTGGGAFEFQADINNYWTYGYSDQTVVDGTTYSYRVMAFGMGIFSEPSNTVTATAEDYYVTVTYPDGSEDLAKNDIVNVTWETNMPGFDATVDLSIDNGGNWQNILHAWLPNESPWPWKVGYMDTEQNPMLPAIWLEYVVSTDTECLIRVRHYQDEFIVLEDVSNATFTITVP